MKLIKILLLAVSAALLVLSFPGHDYYMLAWVALSPLLVIVFREKKRVFWQGFAFGVFFYFGNIYWLNHTLMVYGGMPAFLSIPILLLLVAYLSLYYGLFCLQIKALHKRYPRWGMWTAPFIWVGLEWVRSFLLTGFPWSLLGYSQHCFLRLIQISEYTGVYGISFLIVLSNLVIARFILFPGLKKRTLLEFLSFLALIGGIILWGNGKIKSFSAREKQPDIRIAVIQGNIEQEIKWNPEEGKKIIQIYDSLTRQAAERKIHLVLWPETAIPFFIQNSPESRKWIQNLSHDVAAPIITGAMTFNVASRQRIQYFNSSIIITPDKKISKLYDKIHMVPFGEYVPLQDILFFVRKMVQTVGDFTPGIEPSIYNGRRFSCGTVICFEVIFPDLVRRFVKKGANLVLNLTNDAWFGKLDAPFQHWSMAVFRSVENRVWMVRAANTGISGFIDPMGREVKKTGIFSREIKICDVNIPQNLPLTFYTRFGDVFSKGCFLISILFSFMCFGVTHRFCRRLRKND